MPDASVARRTALPVFARNGENPAIASMTLMGWGRRGNTGRSLLDVCATVQPILVPRVPPLPAESSPRSPDQPWVIVIGIVIAVMVLGAAGYLLNSRGLNMALVSICLLGPTRHDQLPVDSCTVAAKLRGQHVAIPPPPPRFCHNQRPYLPCRFKSAWTTSRFSPFSHLREFSGRPLSGTPSR